MSTIKKFRTPVLNKQNFVQRYQAGEFGNRSLSWETLEELLASGYTQPVHIRNRLAGGETWYDVPIDKVEILWTHAARKYGKINLYIGAMGPPDHTRLLQGEVSLGPQGERLLYTDIKLPMRDALAKWSREVIGLEAKMLLDWRLCSRSRDWLNYLLDVYIDHVVEFTAYSVSWGTVPGYNTLFWEVRKY